MSEPDLACLNHVFTNRKYDCWLFGLWENSLAILPILSGMLVPFMPGPAGRFHSPCQEVLIMDLNPLRYIPIDLFSKLNVLNSYVQHKQIDVLF
jgi:hypothetical protein